MVPSKHSTIEIENNSKAEHRKGLEELGINSLDFFPRNFCRQCNILNGLLVNVSNNRISGVLKTGTMCKSLKYFNVFKNQIFDSIPQGLRDLILFLI